MILNLLKKQLGFFLLFAALLAAGTPDWNVTPSQYLYSANLTAKLIVNDTVTGSGNTIAAFVGNEVRGVATPLQVGNAWLYFLTVYSNAGSGETVTLKAYLGTMDVIIDINESIPFTANSVIGTPGAPFQLHGYMNYDFTPLLVGVPDQTVESGADFNEIDLRTYLTELDGDSILWSATGNSVLAVSLNANGTVRIFYPAGFSGIETIIFTAQDNTVHGYSSADTVTFTVLPPDYPPQVANIPDQKIGRGGSFPTIMLDSYLTSYDGDSIVWSYITKPANAGAPEPVWAINPTVFQFSMNVTAKVLSHGNTVLNGNHLLAAFSGNELRGVTQGVPVSDGVLYFLTMYSNTSGEQIQFKFYDAVLQELLPVAERFTFDANAIQGTPDNPLILHATNLIVTIDDAHIAHTTLIDTAWTGSEQVIFIATEANGLHALSDSDDVVLSVFPDHTPLLEGIQNQTIESGGVFASFDLDTYLTERDNESVIWSTTGNSNLNVSINAQHVVTIVPANPTWVGTETIIFTVTDSTSNAFFDTDTATYTIDPVDHRPDISNIPNQTIGLGGSFQNIDLNFYLTELDGDSIDWSFAYLSNPRGNTMPAWSVNPSQYQFSMNITAQVTSRNVLVANGNYKLGAFSGNELRGVAQPVQAGTQWLFFLTVYANTSGEQIRFKLFDAQLQDVIPVKEQVAFEPTGISGTPELPIAMNAGNIILSKDAQNIIHFDIVDTTWRGNEIVYFTVRDANRSHHFSDVDQAIFTIINDHSPVLTGIPDQEVEQGQQFAVINLGDYLSEIDGQSIIWSSSFSSKYTVTINADKEALVVPKNINWIGSDDIVFQAKDATAAALSDQDTVRFTVIPVDHHPEISSDFSQEVPTYGSFASFDLDDYVTNLDADSIEWSYEFIAPLSAITSPVWSINPNTYQYSMTLTAKVRSLSKFSTNQNCMLAAYAGNEIRGVTAPVQVGNTLMYFLTIYSNGEGETIRFQFYDAEAGRIIPVKESIPFSPNGILGGPVAPVSLNAGNLLVTKSNDNIITIERTLQSWLGTERLVFIARDMHTAHLYSDTTEVQFTVIQDAFGNAQTSITLGDIPVHVTKVETVSVTNTGMGDLYIPSVSIDNPDYTVTPTSVSLAENETQKFIITFTPTSSGNKNATLKFLHNAYRSPRDISLIGSGQYLVITATADGNGLLTPLGAKNISYGTDQLYEIEPERGHKIDSVVIDGVNNGIITNYQFLNVIGHHSITAYFSIIPSYGVTYRTATMEDWATALDQRGLRRQINRRYDKVTFSFDLTADLSRQLRLLFNMDAEGVLTKGTLHLDTIATFTGGSFTGNLSSLISAGQVIHVTGVGHKGRYITSRYAWGTNPLKAILKKEYKSMKLGIPLPNLINVGKEMFGIGQHGAFPNGLRIGVAQGVRGGGSVVHYKFKDVMNSLAQEMPTGALRLHTQGPQCLDSLNDGTPMSFRERSLSVNRQDNKLFAEALTLRLNIVASMLGKFPVGFGELKYSNPLDTADVFNGMTIKSISLLADTVLSCQPLPGNLPVTFGELYTTLRSINGSFRTDGKLDTLSFMKSTRLTGTKRLLDVEFLLSANGMVAQTMEVDEDLSNDENEQPSQFSLRQNYPNPFNPATVIGYQVSTQSTVTLRVYDMLGREVTTLLDKADTEAGEYEIEFDASGLGSGIYFYRLSSQSTDENGFVRIQSDVKRMMLVK